MVVNLHWHSGYGRVLLPCSPADSPGTNERQRYFTSSTESSRPSNQEQATVFLPQIYIPLELWVGHHGVHVILGVYNIIQTLRLQYQLQERRSLLPSGVSFAQQSLPLRKHMGIRAKSLCSGNI